MRFGPTTLDRDASPLIAAVEMGYGHLRAAQALSAALGCEVVEVDRPPLVTPDEARLWRRFRRGYELVSRASQVPFLGRPLHLLLEALTDIPHLYPYRDQSATTVGVDLLHGLIRRGLGGTLVRTLKRDGRTLLTTFFAPAIAADEAGLDRVVLVVTDSDINRVWVPRYPSCTRIEYCVPSERAMRRLRAYGVPAARIHFTGFPLPPELTGGDDLDLLRHRLAGRLVRLDPAGTFREQLREELTHFLGPLPAAEEGRPPRLTFAVGGAGAQYRMAAPIVASLADAVRAGRLRLALVAGVRGAIAESFRGRLAEQGLGDGDRDEATVLFEPELSRYFARFNRLLADTDILWTKPSEMTFFGALGLAMVFARPVGVHERLNRRWAIQRGAGVKQDTPAYAGQWLTEMLQDGTLAGAAWSGYMRLPKFGTRRILDVVRSFATRP